MGAAVALPGKLVHPFSVVVTVYIPGVVTVMLEVVAPVLHSNSPSAVVDRVDEPQSLTTVITGVVGISFSTITASPFICDVPDSFVPETV